MATFKLKGKGITGTDNIPDNIRQLFRKNNFDTLTSEELQTLTTGLVKCSLQTVIEQNPSKSDLIDFFMGNPLLGTALNGYSEVIMNYLIEADYNTGQDESQSEFSKSIPKFDSFRIALLKKMATYKYTLDDVTLTGKYNEFNSNSDIQAFLGKLYASVVASLENDIIRLHQQNMELMIKDTYTSLPNGDSKNTIFIRKASPIMYTEASGIITPGTDAAIEGAISQLKTVLSDMQFTSKDFNPLGFASTVDMSNLVLIVPYKVQLALETYKSGQFNPISMFEGTGLTVKTVNPIELGEGASEIITRTGFDPLNTLDGSGLTLDSSKINFILMDKRIMCYKRPEVSVRVTQSASGEYTNYFTHCNNAMFTHLPKGYLPAVIFTSTATSTTDITKAAKSVVYDAELPGHRSLDDQFVPE